MRRATPKTPDDSTPGRRSGGPKTDEGKQRSRRNALKHGLRAKVVVPEEMAREIRTRAAQFRREFQPRTAYQAWLVGQIARETVRIDRSAELSLADLKRRIDHDGPCWELDRRRDIAAFADRLRRNPGRVLPALEADRHGIDWLLVRWEALAEILENGGAWDEDQGRLALDLLGVPVEVRTGRPCLPEPAQLPAFVRAQIARLRDLQQSALNDRDQARRSLTELGLSAADEPTSRPLRRYEQSCRRALTWARAELRRHQGDPDDFVRLADFADLADLDPGPPLIPAPTPATVSAPSASPSPAPARPNGLDRLPPAPTAPRPVDVDPFRNRLASRGTVSQALEKAWLDAIVPAPRDCFQLDLAIAPSPATNGHAAPAGRPVANGRPEPLL